MSALIDDAQTRGSERIARPIDIAALLAAGFVRSGTAPVRRTHRAAIVARTAAAQNLVTLLAFAIGTQEFALPIDQVDEVIRLPDDIAAMPQSDDAVIGSAAHRGALLPLLSLRRLLSLPDGDDAAAPRIVIARIGRYKVGLLVDAVRAILRVAEDEIDTIPAALTRGAGEARIQAICRLDGGRRLVSLLAANQLLRDDVIARLADDQKELHDMAGTEARQGETEQFLLFRIGDEDFGLPIAAVSEVVRMPDTLGRLPRAPAFVEGIMNLRGHAIPVIDQRRRFDVAAEGGQRRRVVIVRLGDTEAGFVVDGVSDVVTVPREQLQPSPDLGEGAVRMFDRVATLDDGRRMILLVEPRELLDRAERDLLAAMALGETSPTS